MALATQAHLEMFLQIDVTSEPDAAVTMLLENASGIVKSYVDRDLELTTYTAELHDGQRSPDLWLDHWPIDMSTPPVVTEDGTVLVEGTDYLVYAEEGKLVRIGGTAGARGRRWRHKLQTVSVNYSAGYDFTTDPLLEPEAVIARDVTTRIAGRVFQAAAAFANTPVSSSGLRSISLTGSDSLTFSDAVSGPGGVTMAAPQLLPSDMEALDRLRRRELVS